DVTAGDRAPAVRPRVRIFEDGKRVVRRLGAVPVVEVPPLHTAPAEIDAAPPPHVGRPVVDLFPGALTDVSEDEVPVDAVERETPRVADAVRPDPRLPRRLAHERVVRRHRVRVGAALARVDAQDLPTELLEVLAGPERVAAAPAVSSAHVEHPVGPELE